MTGAPTTRADAEGPTVRSAAAERAEVQPAHAGGDRAHAGGARTWWVVSAFDVFTASLRGEPTWPTVLRPASVAQRVEDGRRAAAQARTAGDGSSDETLPGGGHSGGGERLCALALPIAESTRVRAVHWYQGAAGTVIAETACGPETSVVLVGWAPYDASAPHGRGTPDATGALEAPDLPGGAGAPDPDQKGEPRTLPGALLLGIFDTGTVARRLAELVGKSATPADTIVVGRWSLPEGCPPMAVRSVVHPQPGVLRRELVAQLTEAFCRVQSHAQDRRDTDGPAEGTEASRWR